MMSHASSLGDTLSLPVIDDDDLHAYVDRQLSSDRRAEIDLYLREHASPSHRVGTYIAQREALRAALAGPAREPIPPRLDPHLLARHRTSERRTIWRVAAAVVLALGVGGTVDYMLDGGFGLQNAEQRVADTFGRQAAAAYLTLAKTDPQPLQMASIDGLSEGVSKALGVPVKLHDTAASGFAMLGGWVLPSSNGHAVQLAFRDVQDNKIITMYLEGRPGAKETPFRRIAGASVPTVAWEDDDLACAISGAVAPEQLEKIGRRIYDALLS
jgi:anti-sigma factor RsiW